MKQILLVALLAANACFPLLKAQTVTTISPTASKIDDDLIFDSNGNLFGSGYDAGKVYKLTPDGALTIFAEGLSNANGLAWNDDGSLVVVDNTGNKIYKVQPDGTKTVLVPNITGPSGLLRLYGSDTMIVTTYINHKVFKMAPDGSLTEYLTHPEFNGPVGLCYDDDQNLYVANFGDRKIFKVTPDGTVTFLTQPPLGQSIGFLAYANGFLYATAFNAHKIYKIDLDGNYNVWLGSTAGGTDGDASVAKFSRPNGIRFSSTGDTLYVSEYGGKRVRRITNLEGTSGVTDQVNVVGHAMLSPNPATGFSKFTFDLKVSTPVTIELFDLQGNMVKNICSESTLTPGHYVRELNVKGLVPGTYMLQMRTRESTTSRRLVVAN